MNERHAPPRIPCGRRVAPAPIAKAAGLRHVRDALEHADSTWFIVCFAAGVAPALVAVGVYRLSGPWVPTVPALVALVLLPRARRGLEAAAAVASAEPASAFS